MIWVSKIGQTSWIASIVEKHAPAGAKYFTFVAQGEPAALDLAHDTMLGLALTNKGSGVLTIKNIANDFFFDKPMTGYFV